MRTTDGHRFSVIAGRSVIPAPLIFATTPAHESDRPNLHGFSRPLESRPRDAANDNNRPAGATGYDFAAPQQATASR
jgi:hypothetical protein